MLNRLFILLIGIAFVGSAKAQIAKYFIWDEQPHDKKVIVITKHIKVFNFFQLEKAKDFLPFIDNFHMVDIDSDGDYDMIYNGYSTGESEIVVFFLNKNGEYIIENEYWGRLSEVYAYKSAYTMYLKYYGCCGDYENRDYKVKCEFEPDKLSFRVENVLIYHEETPQPKLKFESPIKFIVENDKYYLRVTPEVNNTESFFPREKEGNDYKIFIKGDKGVAYGEHTDATGRVWWYVRMNPKEEYEDNTINVRVEEGFILKPAYIGWMSSRYLKKSK